MSNVNSNPWHVTSLQDFQYFCCPECDYRHKDAPAFIDHAALLHEQAKETLVNLHLIPKPEKVKTEILEENVKVVIKEEENEYQETQDYEYEEFEFEEAEDDDYEDPDYDDGKVDDIGDFDEDTKESRQVKPKTKRMKRDPDNIASDTEHTTKIKLENGDTFECEFCDKIFIDERSWVRHEWYERRKFNLGKKSKREKQQEKDALRQEMYKNPCSKCDRRFKSEQALKLHKVKSHNEPINKTPDSEKISTCNICNKVFKGRNAMQYHKSKYHDDQVTCDICGKITNKHDMVMHRKRAHHLYDIPPEKLVRKCDKCDSEFKNGEEMDQHLKKLHSCDKTIKCKDCDKTWVSHLSLELHMVEIHKKVMYCCDLCGYVTHLATILKKHKKIVHEGKRDHVCHICGTSLEQSWKLKEHLAKNHGIGTARFKCEFCGKAFNDSSTLRNHREGVHLKNVKYNCDQCDYFAYCQNRLGKHKRLKHKIYLTRI